MKLKNSLYNKIFIIVYIFLFFLSPAIQATDHKKPVMEPYALQGKRMVFTSWFYIRPGHFDWLNEKGESVYARMETTISRKRSGKAAITWVSRRESLYISVFN
jgi:hypothetical protein